jgi:adenylosuccinate lyase
MLSRSVRKALDMILTPGIDYDSDRNIATLVNDMSLTPLDALSPLDGRYHQAASALRPFLSEAALIRERIRIEAEWFLYMSQHVLDSSGKLTTRVQARAEALAVSPPANATDAVKTIEKHINHDVKAVEYYLREELASAGATAAELERIHFGCTSEDINNLSYARLLLGTRTLLLNSVDELIGTLEGLAVQWADVAMLARTHGQTASPTTLGKEIANFVARLRRMRQRYSAVAILGKWNGAVGNFNAHVAALPQIEWPAVGQRFVEQLGLQYNPYSTQIEPHDWIGEYCDAVAALNVVLIDLSRDFWGYISLGYLKQRSIGTEVGSSTMPHKINPIDFENAEGNLGIANALLRHFSEKLPVSRWQRDLTDSTVLRNLGVALGHSLIAWHALKKGLSKVTIDSEKITTDVAGAWEVLAEPVQTVLRAAGVANGYEQLKAFTRGKTIDAAALAQFIEQLPLTAAQRSALRALQPQQYIGLAAQLARAIKLDH